MSNVVTSQLTLFMLGSLVRQSTSRLITLGDIQTTYEGIND